MTTLTPLRQIELVVVARNQEATLDQSVRRLRDHLLRRGADLFPSGWRITIADHASTDATGAIAERLAAELDDVGFVHLSQQVDRKALRSNWAQSQATIAAFVTLDPEVDLDALLRPLVTHSGGSEPVTAGGLTRRGALFAAGGIGLTALLASVRPQRLLQLGRDDRRLGGRDLRHVGREHLGRNRRGHDRGSRHGRARSGDDRGAVLPRPRPRTRRHP